MDIDRVSFESLANGGDDVTGALVKLDHTTQQLADEVTNAENAATSLTTRVTNVEAKAAAAKSAADTANNGLPAKADKTYVDTQDATKLPVSNPKFTGGMLKDGVYGEYTLRVQNTGTQTGIGGSFTESNAGRMPAVQVDAQSMGSAYMPLRVTHWGARHLWQLDVYEGGSGTSVPQVIFHFDAGLNKHIFYATGAATFAGALTQNSDYRIKDDVETIDPMAAAAALRLARPIEYRDNRLDDSSPRCVGFIAHELQALFPLLVQGQKDAVDWQVAYEGDTTPYPPGEEPEGWVPPTPHPVEVPVLQNVNYAGQVPYLTAGWQEHDLRIARLEHSLAASEAAFSALLDRVSALESR